VSTEAPTSNCMPLCAAEISAVLLVRGSSQSNSSAMLTLPKTVQQIQQTINCLQGEIFAILGSYESQNGGCYRYFGATSLSHLRRARLTLEEEDGWLSGNISI